MSYELVKFGVGFGQLVILMENINNSWQDTEATVKLPYGADSGLVFYGWTEGNYLYFIFSILW